MRSLGFILVLTLVTIAHTNIEARNVELWNTNIAQQDPGQYDHMLPKGSVPPTRPGRGTNPPVDISNGAPGGQPSQHFHTHILPKGDHHPPPGPSHGSTPDPPGPPPTL